MSEGVDWDYIEKINTLIENEDLKLPYNRYYKGIEYEISRHPLGYLCGYILIPSSLKNIVSMFYLSSIHDIFHGGITYKSKEGCCLVLGFDCGHEGDLCIKYKDNIPETQFMLTGEYRNLTYVKTICKQAIKFIATFN